MQQHQQPQQQHSLQQQSQEQQQRANVLESSRQRNFKGSLTPSHHQMSHHIEETVAEVVGQSAAYYRASNLTGNPQNDTSWDDEEDIDDEDLMDDESLLHSNSRSMVSGVISPVGFLKIKIFFILIALIK